MGAKKRHSTGKETQTVLKKKKHRSRIKRPEIPSNAMKLLNPNSHLCMGKELHFTEEKNKETKPTK